MVPVTVVARRVDHHHTQSDQRMTEEDGRDENDKDEDDMELLALVPI